SDPQPVRDVRRARQARLHGADDERARPGEPRLRGQRQPRRRPRREDYSAGALDESRPADYLGHSVIAGPAFPRFSHVYGEAGNGEELISATLSFERLHRWQSVFPMREWRETRQSDASRLIAEEFRALAERD